MSLAKIVEAYYSPADLAALWRFSERKIRDLCKAGEFTVTDGQGHVLAQPLVIAGEIRIPASAVNAYADRHAYNYHDGIKARNAGELRRKMEGKAA